MRTSSSSAVLILLLCTVATARLVSVSALVRHGNRAPNKGILEVCPNYPNLQRYAKDHVAPQMLTPHGMGQLAAFGEYVRHSYLINGQLADMKDYVPTKVNSQAAVDLRCIQSCAAAGSALYPAGTGPQKAPARGHAYYAIQSNQKSHDNLLGCRKARCLPNLVKDTAAWETRHVPMMLAKYEPTMRAIQRMCGKDLTTLPVTGLGGVLEAVKTINDALHFDAMAGYPLMQGAGDIMPSMNDLAFEYIKGSVYSLEEQIVYVAGELPGLLHHTWGQKEPKTPLTILCAHRELLYGLNYYYGFNWAVPGLAVGQVHPGTAIIFEEHEDSGERTVNAHLWYPDVDGGHYTTIPLQFNDGAGHSCTRCPVSFVHGIQKAWEATVGKYTKICPKEEEEHWARSHPHFDEWL